MDLQNLIPGRAKTRVFDPQERIRQRAETAETAKAPAKNLAHGPVDTSIQANDLIKFTNLRTSQIPQEEKLAGAQDKAQQARLSAQNIRAKMTEVQNQDASQDIKADIQMDLDRLKQEIQQMAHAVAAAGLNPLTAPSASEVTEAQLDQTEAYLEASFLEITAAQDLATAQNTASADQAAQAASLNGHTVNANISPDQARHDSQNIATYLSQSNASITHRPNHILMDMFG